MRRCSNDYHVVKMGLVLAACTIAPGCFEDEGPHSPTSAGGIDIIEGVIYCAEADGAKVSYDDPTEGGAPSDVFLEDEENDGDGPPQGCECADDLIQAAINLEFGQAQSFVIDGTHSQDLKDFRDLVFEKTVDRCEELALEVVPTPNSHNCDFVLTPGTTPMYPVTGTCVTTVNGAPADNWDDYYSLGSVISLNPANGVYEIDMAFFEDVIANPRWLFADSTSIGFNGVSYQFYGVTSGDIAYALGLQTGWIPLTLNDMDVTNLEEASAAMLDLRYETEYEFVLLGIAGPVTRRYEIVP
jgi:hypothetical protein